jgi:hypothetical protein
VKIPTTATEDYPTGTLTIISSEVKLGEPFKITITAHDAQGVKGVYLFYQLNWHYQDCNGQTSCTKDFNVTEQKVGTYVYFGYIVGTSLRGRSQAAWTTPMFVIGKVIDITIPNTPMGTLSIRPLTTSLTTSKDNLQLGEVTVGEPFTITISAKDAQGVKRVWLKYGGEWHSQECDMQSPCTKDFTVTETNTGEVFSYYGKVEGRTSEGTSEWAKTTPEYVMGEVKRNPIAEDNPHGQLFIKACVPSWHDAPVTVVAEDMQGINEIIGETIDENGNVRWRGEFGRCNGRSVCSIKGLYLHMDWENRYRAQIHGITLNGGDQVGYTNNVDMPSMYYYQNVGAGSLLPDATGTITIEPSTVKLGEPFKITISGHAPNGGISALYLNDGRSLRSQRCDNAVDCTKTFLVKENERGTYTYEAGIKRLSGCSSLNPFYWDPTSPASVTGTVE